MRTLSPRAKKAEEIVEWTHGELHLRYEEIADILGTTTRTLQRWRSHDSTPTRANEEKIERLDELRFWLEQVFDDDPAAMQEWLRTRLMDLRGKTPIEAIRRGHIDRIIEFLATAHAGAFI